MITSSDTAGLSQLKAYEIQFMEIQQPPTINYVINKQPAVINIKPKLNMHLLSGCRTWIKETMFIKLKCIEWLLTWLTRKLIILVYKNYKHQYYTVLLLTLNVYFSRIYYLFLTEGGNSHCSSNFKYKWTILAHITFLHYCTI